MAATAVPSNPDNARLRGIEALFTRGPRFDRLSPIYSFTTENLAYLEALDMADADVLTVCGSGDHALNAVYFGARRVTHFDINLPALWWAELKRAGVLRFTFEEFKNFFFKDRSGSPNIRALDHKQYLRLEELLTPHAKSFFTQLYAASAHDGAALRGSGVFNQRHDRGDVKQRSNPYLRHEESYRELRQRLNRTDISAFAAPMQQLNLLLHDMRFDAVLLSNLADYAYELYPGTASADSLKLSPQPLYAFAREVMGAFGHRLHEEGVICAAYVYDRFASVARSAVDNPADRRAAFSFPGFFYDEYHLPSVIDGRIDCICRLTRDEREIKRGKHEQRNTLVIAHKPTAAPAGAHRTGRRGPTSG